MSKFPLPSSSGHVTSVFGGGTVAGAEEVDTVPAGKAWYVMAVKQVLAKGGTGTPQPVLQIADQGGNVVWQGLGSSAVQAVNTTCTYMWAPGQSLSAQLGSGVNCMSFAGLPDGLVLPSGYQIKTSTLNGVGATSNYGTPSFFVCELG